MDPQDFVLSQTGDICIGVLAEDDIPDDNFNEFVWILGALFMKNIVTVFNLGAPAVGFGQLKGTTQQFGTYSVVPLEEMTALGTGPFASVSPTFIPSERKVWRILC